MASSWRWHQASWSAVVEAPVATSTRLRTRCGWLTGPFDGAVPAQRGADDQVEGIDSQASARRVSAATASRVVSHGKREPQGRPSGAMEEGPVEPWHPPRMLAATTK